MVFSRKFRTAIRLTPHALLVALVVPPCVCALGVCILFKHVLGIFGFLDTPVAYYDLLRSINAVLDYVGMGEVIRRRLFGARTASDQFERELSSQV